MRLPPDTPEKVLQAAKILYTGLHKTSVDRERPSSQRRRALAPEPVPVSPPAKMADDGG